MGQQAFDTDGRINGFKFNPQTDIAIPGIDMTGPGHPMFQPEILDFKRRLDAGEFAADVADYKARGVMVAIEVVKDKETGKAIPVFGRKRTLILRAANKELEDEGKEPWKIPAMLLQRGTKQTEAMLRTISENTGRYTLNAMELSEIAANFIKLNGDDDAVLHDLCVALRLDRRRLDKLLLLREASPALHRAINEGQLGTEGAIALSEMPVSEQGAKLEELKAKAKANGKTRVSTEDARAAKVGKHPRPSTRKIKRVCDLLAAQGANADTLSILRFCVGDIPIEKTVDVFKSAWIKVSQGKDKDEIKDMKKSAKAESKKTRRR